MGRTILRAHFGDVHKEVRTWFYQRVDPRQPPRYVVDLHPFTLAPQSPVYLNAGSSTRTIDPSLKRPVSRQASVSVERLLSPTRALGDDSRQSAVDSQSEVSSRQSGAMEKEQAGGRTAGIWRGGRPPSKR